MARPRKDQEKPLEPETVPGATPEPKRLTPADLGYKPGDVVPLHDLNRLTHQ